MQGKLPQHTHYNVTFRQYEDFNTLNVFFFYRAELPEGAFMRVIEADGVAGQFGEAVITLANIEGTDSDLLNAKIFTQSLPLCSTITVACCAPDETELYRATYTLKKVEYPATGQAGHFTGNTTPSPTNPWSVGGSWGKPTATPYNPFPNPFPNYNQNNGGGNSLTDAIEEGMQIQVPNPGGFFW